MSHRRLYEIHEHRMLLRQIGLIGSFVFHGSTAKRVCAGFPSSSAALQHQVPFRSVLHQRTRTSLGARSRHRVGTASVAMSSTPAAGEQTKVVLGMRELCDRYDGFILDQFGVLHDGKDALPGAVECLEELRSKGKRLVILSNTSKRESFTMARLPKFGFRQELFDGGVTSGEEGYQHLVRTGLVGGKAVLLGWNGEDSDGFLAALSLKYSSPQEATFLLCHGPDNIVVDDTGAARTDTRNTGQVEPYEAVFKAAIDRDLPMYNVNPDITVNNPQGGLWHMPGLLAKRYEAMGGRVTYFGKPHKEHYETAVAKMGLDRSTVVHVGDSLAHDIVGASSAGIDSVFIAGGICGEELGVDAKADPSTFNLSPEALESIFTRESVTPTWTMPLFAL